MWNQILEDAITGKIVTTLIDNGYRVEMSDQDGGDLFVYAAPHDENEGRMPPGGYHFWVRLTPGNGADIVADYTQNLENLLAPINQFCETFRE